LSVVACRYVDGAAALPPQESAMPVDMPLLMKMSALLMSLPARGASVVEFEQRRDMFKMLLRL